MDQIFYSPQTFEANLNPSFFFFPFTKTFYENQKSCVILVSGGSVWFLVNWCEACWSFYQLTSVLVVCVFLTISLMCLGSWFLVTFEAIFYSINIWNIIWKKPTWHIFKFIYIQDTLHFNLWKYGLYQYSNMIKETTKVPFGIIIEAKILNNVL